MKEEQINGKSISERQKTLEQLVGIEYEQSFGAKDSESLKLKIADMGLSELQSFCSRVGVNPYGNKTALKTRIQEEFKRKSGYNRSLASSLNQVQLNPRNPRHKKAIKFLRD